MKNIKNIFSLILIMSLASCIQNTGKFKEESAAPAPDSNGNSGPVSHGGSSGNRVSEVKEDLVSGVYIKNFNQINMSFSKLTGIARSRSEVTDIMSQVLNQLPANNDLNSFTPFHQLSITRLAFTYCELFVEEDSEFSSLDYSNISSDALAQALIDRFLDKAPSDDPNKYDVLKEEVISVLNNDDIDEAGKLVDESGVSKSELMKRLTKMSCSIILSSSFVTLM